MAGCFFIVILFSVASGASRQAKQAGKASARARGRPPRPRRGFGPVNACCVWFRKVSAPWAPPGQDGLRRPASSLQGSARPRRCWKALWNPLFSSPRRAPSSRADAPRRYELTLSCEDHFVPPPLHPLPLLWNRHFLALIFHLYLSLIVKLVCWRRWPQVASGEV